MEQVLRCPAVAAACLATTELILAIQKAFPAVRLVPCAPIEGKDIHLWAYLPMQAEEQLTIQDRIVAIEHTVQEKYGVQTVVVALPEPAQYVSHGGESEDIATTP
jgi:hypothetical protein